MKDPRRIKKGNFKYPLIEILFVALSCAVSGIQEWKFMVQFSEKNIDWFRKFFDYENGIPSHDTLERVFSMIEPEAFCMVFQDWVYSLNPNLEGDVISIDGKTIRSSGEKSKDRNPIHLVSAFAAENRLVLSQIAVDEKSNEITAVPQLLDLIDCKGAIITVDALNCQTAIAEKIIEKEADYLFALKGNHKFFYEEVVSRFSNQTIDNENTTEELNAGRIEKRKCSVIQNLDFVDTAKDWKSIKSIVKIESERYMKSSGKTTKETRYYISSLVADAQMFNKHIRNHWSVENNLHWQLDITFKEDNSKKRKINSAINFSLLCKTALNLLSKHKVKYTSYNQLKFKALLEHNLREKFMGLS